jgi:hypothetical protein
MKYENSFRIGFDPIPGKLWDTAFVQPMLMSNLVEPKYNCGLDKGQKIETRQGRN